MGVVFVKHIRGFTDIVFCSLGGRGYLPAKSASTQMMVWTCLKYQGARIERDQLMLSKYNGGRVVLASEASVPLTKIGLRDRNSQSCTLSQNGYGGGVIASIVFQE